MKKEPTSLTLKAFSRNKHSSLQCQDVIYPSYKKLVCLSLKNPSGKFFSLPVEKSAPLGEAQTFLFKEQARIDFVALDKCSSLFCIGVNYATRKFYNIGPQRQFYKTFYSIILLMFIISQRVCPWQAFPAQSNVRGYRVEYLKVALFGQALALLKNI